MPIRLRCWTRGTAAIILSALATTSAVATFPAQAPGPKPDPRALAPWPDDTVLEERRREAETRRLFRSEDLLEFAITADFAAVNRDRNPESERTFPATLEYSAPQGGTAAAPIQIRTRGHSRRNPRTCSFAPLRLEFDKPTMKGTVFAGHNAIKLGTHCRETDDYEQYVLREYAVYKVFNRLTPRSFRARLARVTYISDRNKRTIGVRHGLLIEDDDDVAERMLGRIVSVPGVPFRALDLETLTRMTIFEFMIGNTDYSAAAQHNVRLVQTREGRRFPVPYDFDYSGLVDAVYSVPDKRLGIADVRDRLYRGPCRTVEEFEPFFAEFRAARADILNIYATLPGMSDGYRREAARYLDEFYRLIDRPRDVKRAFVDDCNGRAGSE
jgi:hypothetical protein